VLVAGRVAIFAELPAPLGSLPELLRPAALAGPDGTPLTPCVPAPRRTPAIEAFEWSSPRMLFAVRRTPAMMMTLYRTRFSEQIEIIKTEELPGLWREQS
jgi:hypothetical protein